jgi:hypothetical protein
MHTPLPILKPACTYAAYFHLGMHACIPSLPSSTSVHVGLLPLPRPANMCAFSPLPRPANTCAFSPFRDLHARRPSLIS